MPTRAPRWVYGQGNEPDYRFTLANERTFLAWIRTALALAAAGVATGALTAHLPATTRHLASTGLLCLAAAAVAIGWLRWARSERAIRLGKPLPAATTTAPIGLCVIAVCVALLLAS
ncbi:DUF202 domain-containing protein [Nocardia sp. NPDC019395]|uniref:YidH family protein n=1 Tax=Nocardia sp. NPDC019395 TaxID=3154686 RepID=UPI0033D8989C